jgi:hypothetical protein
MYNVDKINNLRFVRNGCFHNIVGMNGINNFKLNTWKPLIRIKSNSRNLYNIISSNVQNNKVQLELAALIKEV